LFITTQNSNPLFGTTCGVFRGTLNTYGNKEQQKEISYRADKRNQTQNKAQIFCGRKNKNSIRGFARGKKALQLSVASTASMQTITSNGVRISLKQASAV
jgi:hypothetical protein